MSHLKLVSAEAADKITPEQELQLSCLMQVVLEREKQDAKWGRQSYDPEKWYPILGEEFGEVGKSILEWNFKYDNKDQHTYLEEYRKELVQTAAVCIAMLEDSYRRFQ